ncbi:MAG TPA: hypothetical protein PKE63_06115 [Lacibacter sp.]|nr:hypothetical protein [Lacibacter sp.]HMO87969.1 hypothetical protein [Lacibacter sp.]HMP86834.1 hypothetical protein [Lacibacter sp.]
MSVFAVVLLLAILLYGIITGVDALLQRRHARMRQRLLARMERMCTIHHVVTDKHEFFNHTLVGRSTAGGKLLLAGEYTSGTQERVYNVAGLQSLTLSTEPGADGRIERIYLNIENRNHSGNESLLLFERCGAERDDISRVNAGAWSWETTLRSLLDVFPSPVPMVQAEETEGQRTFAAIPA